MEQLVKGVLDFQKNAYQERKDLFETLSTGQSPKTLFITCSDSRISPDLMTQSEPGDLFVTRNAGNIVRPYTGEGQSTAAAIEYAVNALGVEHIVICGHSDCGAMKGAIDPSALEEALPVVSQWLTHAKGAVDVVKSRCGCAGMDQLDQIIEENVVLQIQHLKTHPSVAAKLATNELTIHGWVYDIKSGSIASYDCNKNVFDLFENVYSNEIEQINA